MSTGLPMFDSESKTLLSPTKTLICEGDTLFSLKKEIVFMGDEFALFLLASYENPTRVPEIKQTTEIYITRGKKIQ